MTTSIQIEPTSIAGILLREHDNPEQAAAYARHVAQRNQLSNPSMAEDYTAAAKAIEDTLLPQQGRERQRCARPQT